MFELNSLYYQIHDNRPLRMPNSLKFLFNSARPDVPMYNFNLMSRQLDQRAVLVKNEMLAVAYDDIINMQHY